MAINAELMKEWMDQVNKAKGTTSPALSIIYDEFTDWLPIKLPIAEVARYENSDYLSATVIVSLKTRDGRDPRNPNPRALASAKFYAVTCGTRILGEYNAPALAKIQAQTFHKRLVDTLIAREFEEHEMKLSEQQARSPHFGKF